MIIKDKADTILSAGMENRKLKLIICSDKAGEEMRIYKQIEVEIGTLERDSEERQRGQHMTVSVGTK